MTPAHFRLIAPTATLYARFLPLPEGIFLASILIVPHEAATTLRRSYCPAFELTNPEIASEHLTTLTGWEGDCLPSTARTFTHHCTERLVETAARYGGVLLLP